MAARIAYTGNIVTNGLVLNLDAGKVDSYPRGGTVWRDLSGNGITGTLTNGPTFDNGNDGSIAFDGSNDYVTLGTPTILNGMQVPLTIIAWTKANTLSGRRTIYGVYGSTVGGGIYSMIRVDFGVLKYYTSDSTGAFQSAGTFTPSINVWNFYCVTVSGTLSAPTVTIYLNTSSQTFSYTTLTSSPSLTVDFRIGGNQAQSITECWNGNITQVSVYNRALSSTEVSQNFNALRGRYGI